MDKKARAALFGGSLVMGVATYGVYRYVRPTQADVVSEHEHPSATDAPDITEATESGHLESHPTSTDEDVASAPSPASVELTPTDIPSPGRHRAPDNLRITEYGTGHGIEPTENKEG
jgi:hypothetical protein